MNKILECWVKVQSAWIYLEPIFSSEDIRRQMEYEGKIFVEVDTIWKEIMESSIQNPNALAVTSKRDMLDKFEQSICLLEEINKGLNIYLEKKRLFFSRFFFLSNDELLEILSETKDPLRVQPHLSKCFEGIKKLKFDAEKFIEGMESSEGECVRFIVDINPHEANGLVEIWLQQVESVMRMSLRAEALKALDKSSGSDVSREEWIKMFPGQIVLVVNLLNWTSEVTKAIASGENGLNSYLKESNGRLDEIVSMVRGDLPKMTRITVEALIVIDVHGKHFFFI